MTRQSDQDRYYTPPPVAKELLALASHLPRVRVVVDPACGAGSLLRAAYDNWPNTTARGFDIDGRAVNRAKRLHESWDLVVGSIYPRVRVAPSWIDEVRHDLVVMNPPYSMTNRHFVEVECEGKVLRTSVAMAHLLSAIQHLSPLYGVLAVMPESALHSDLDTDGRDYLSTNMRLVRGPSVSDSAFQGARARSVLCAWLRKEGSSLRRRGKRTAPGKLAPFVLHEGTRSGCTFRELPLNVELIRGALPTFSVKDHRRGVPYLHSTDLVSLAEDGESGLRRIARTGNRYTIGHVVLVPRVGGVKMAHVVATHFADEVFLSDCVIALAVSSERKARRLRALIRENWMAFIDLYRGTGAPFITVERLRAWLTDKRIEVTVAD